MVSTKNPRHPIFIVSKGRAQYGPQTARVLDAIGVPYRIIVEDHEVDDYSAKGHADRLCVLPPSYKKNYKVLDGLGLSKSTGPGPARNFAWDVALGEGATSHWVMDDNIQGFFYAHANEQIRICDGALFRFAEDFTAQYLNVPLAGPQYEMFVPRKKKFNPFQVNTRIYSCSLIRNDSPFRWRGRYNEDTIMSLDVLRGGYMTILFQFLLQNKVATQIMKGGNTDEFYTHAEGTKAKSEMLKTVYPQFTKLKWKYKRHHHVVDYKSAATSRKLVRRPDAAPIIAPVLVKRRLVKASQ